MLTCLTSLPFSSLKSIDEEADNIVVRTHPFYEAAYLIQSYTRHILRPHVDAKSDHDRHFLKVSFLNKGIDFIDLPSIFRDTRVTEAIPKYFKNSEPPVICYKYNKPVRNVIFNYNKIVADLNIDSSTPTACNCKNSKFCYLPAGHVITGNFDIINDKRIRNVFLRGPKYRLPLEINFDDCKSTVAQSIEEFSIKWCRREKADSNALANWKKQIFKIINTRVHFYQSHPSLLPPKPKFSLRVLRKSIQEFNSNYVLVPADKASNNIIIV